MSKKLRWFDEGASSLRAFLERRGLEDQIPEGQWYPCPCCLTLFSREAVTAGALTAEDVPPESVGGRKILLTCKSCNNRAGERLDVHAATRRLVHDFARGRETRRRLSATVYAAGVPMRGTIQWSNGGLQIFGVPQQNDPNVTGEHLRLLDSFVDSREPNPPVSFKVDFPTFDGPLAGLSWIRAAYLVAFAYFGWQFVIPDRMQPLRDQFQEPGTITVPVFVDLAKDADPSRKQLLIVRAPADIACVAVTMGEVTVCLPSPYDSKSFEDLAEGFDRYKAAGEGLNLTGDVVTWPASAMYVLK